VSDLIANINPVQPASSSESSRTSIKIEDLSGGNYDWFGAAYLGGLPITVSDLNLASDDLTIDQRVDLILNHLGVNQ